MALAIGAVTLGLAINQAKAICAKVCAEVCLRLNAPKAGGLYKSKLINLSLTQLPAIETIAQSFFIAIVTSKLGPAGWQDLGGNVATIADVARKAGVSVSTVSHVLNGTRRVSPATASAVQAVIDSFGYRPNILARSLKAAFSRSVGIAISSISNPYFSDIICAIETECARLGMMVFLSDTEDEPARELEVVMALHQRRVDGIILAPSADPERRVLGYLRDARVPCVLVDRTPDANFDQVGVNNREAMRKLVDHVAALGHHRIGYVGGHPGFETTLERIAGYRECLLGRGMTIDDRLLVMGNATTSCAMVATEGLLALADPPTALVGGNNLATIGIMKALRRRGLRVPRDISVVGFDDFEWADCFEPRLTLVAQPCIEIGKRAALLLMERIAAPEGARRTIQLDASIVERESCGRLR